MTEAAQNLSGRHSRAARLIDENFEKLAAMLDRFRTDLTTDGQTTTAPLMTTFANKLDVASDRLRTTSGDEVVSYAKVQIARHPTLITVGAAALAAVLAQIAITTVRREQSKSQPVRVDKEVL